jgi:hypothetical protein
MDRREALKKLGVGGAAVAASPLLLQGRTFAHHGSGPHTLNLESNPDIGQPDMFASWPDLNPAETGLLSLPGNSYGTTHNKGLIRFNGDADELNFWLAADPVDKTIIATAGIVNVQAWVWVPTTPVLQVNAIPFGNDEGGHFKLFKGTDWNNFQNSTELGSNVRYGNSFVAPGMEYSILNGSTRIGRIRRLVSFFEGATDFRANDSWEIRLKVELNSTASGTTHFVRLVYAIKGKGQGNGSHGGGQPETTDSIGASHRPPGLNVAGTAGSATEFNNISVVSYEELPIPGGPIP